MAEHFGHEKLKVYQKGMQFASMRKTLLDDLPRRVAACDHLDRGAERSFGSSPGWSACHRSSHAVQTCCPNWTSPQRRSF